MQREMNLYRNDLFMAILILFLQSLLLVSRIYYRTGEAFQNLLIIHEILIFVHYALFWKAICRKCNLPRVGSSRTKTVKFALLS
jgi:hypothetical protein